eukprot:TRINITY_DN2171_c0_g1_i1.p1 TRINITY_DN2171_c0_g1~~TRINITY_DN2171_c0_g1_i1.p1  ORF type:complete len:520 (+),score=57.15 TRINITY_DN2171_c0_g1_i1:151-1710(+)
MAKRRESLAEVAARLPDYSAYADEGELEPSLYFTSIATPPRSALPSALVEHTPPARDKAKDRVRDDDDDGDGKGVLSETRRGMREAESDGNGGDMDEEMDMGERDADGRQRVTQGEMLSMSLYWLGRSSMWAAISILLLPTQVERMVGHNYKGTGLGLVNLVATTCTVLGFPLMGDISDRTRPRTYCGVEGGKRLPFLCIGAFMLSVLMLIQSLLGNEGVAWIIPYTLVFMGIEIGDAIASAPYLALYPEIIPQSQYGVSSGWLGTMAMGGNLIGGAGLGLAIGHIGVVGCYVFLAGLILVSLLGTLVKTRENTTDHDVVVSLPSPDDSNNDNDNNGNDNNNNNGDQAESFEAFESQTKPFTLGIFLRDVISPFYNSNFRWVFGTRFLFTAGFVIILSFLNYAMKDAVESYDIVGIGTMPNADVAASIFVGLVLTGSVLSSLLSGVLSDKFGRKLLVYISGSLMALVPFLLLFTFNYSLMLPLGFLFGLGYGGYISVDFALITDVLPSANAYGKDLGIW